MTIDSRYRHARHRGPGLEPGSGNEDRRPGAAADEVRGRRHLSTQSGQETLQAILVVALVLLPVLVSILTFGSLVHTYIGSQAAAAAGARAAGTAGAFGPPQLARVDEELTANGIDPVRCHISASAAEIALDNPISVTVDCPEHVGIPFLFERDVALTSTFVAHGEVNR